MASFSIQTLVEAMDGQDLALGLLLVGVGLVFILVGARVFRVLVVLSFAFIGYALGMGLPLTGVWQVLAAAACGLILAILSTLVTKLAVGTLAGGWSAVAAATLARELGAGDPVALTAGLAALVGAVSFMFIYYRQIIAAVMSFEGTLLLVAGLVVFASHYPGVWNPLRPVVLETPFFGCFLVLAGTVTGFYLQITESQKKQVGLSG